MAVSETFSMKAGGLGLVGLETYPLSTFDNEQNSIHIHSVIA